MGRPVLIFIIGIALVPAVFTAVNMKNIGKLGFGYDIIKGNPDPVTSNGIDPGFRASIFNLGVYDGTTTADKLYNVPKGVEIDSILNCQLSFSTSIILGSASYVKSLQTKVSTDFSGWKAAFKGSVDYNQVSKSTSSDKSVFTRSTAQCEIYRASLKRFTPPKLSTEFTIAVSRLQTTDDYNYFIDYFGTHYFTGMRLGGKFGQQSEISDSNWSKLQDSSLKIEASASASAFGASLAASSLTQIEKSMAQQFSKYTSQQRTYSLGSLIPKDGSRSTWASQVVQDPQAVYYELNLISELFKSEYFPQDTAISTKRTNIIKALGNYCSYLQKKGILNDCSPPSDPNRVRDSVFGGMYQTDDCGQNNVPNELTGSLNCPSGYSSIQVSRMKMPESGCNGNGYFCYDRAKRGSFGGAYQTDDGGNGLFRNPETIRYSCPPGFYPNRFARVLSAYTGGGATTYLCLSNFSAGKSQIGGYYQQTDNSNTIRNPNTGGNSCPVGYRAIKAGRVKTPDGNQSGADSYICILN